MKLCDRCRVPGCLLDYGGKACKNARKQNCPDVVFTNADRVREMNDEELAKFMLSSDGAAYCKNNDRDSTCYLNLDFNHYGVVKFMHGVKDEERQLCLNCAIRVRNWISEQCEREKTEVE